VYCTLDFSHAVSPEDRDAGSEEVAADGGEAVEVDHTGLGHAVVGAEGDFGVEISRSSGYFGNRDPVAPIAVSIPGQ
jgi:hypothetical protein